MATDNFVLLLNGSIKIAFGTIGYICDVVLSQFLNIVLLYYNVAGKFYWDVIQGEDYTANNTDHRIMK
jgi:hypothetical protein